ncbi:MAG: hypothetical protein ACI4SB_06800 [Acutalibacteraceae bacterium]
MNIEGFKQIWDGWLTYIGERDFSEYYRIAKETSKITHLPVLWFDEADKQIISFEIFVDGKVKVSFCNDGLQKNKGIYQIPVLVGYDEENKKRISKILSCCNAGLMRSMLEEFFGVGLKPVHCECSDVLRIKRESVLYNEYLKQEKRITGKSAPIKAVLVDEIPGKLFDKPFEALEGIYKPHLYYYGFDRDYDSEGENRIFKWVEFKDGRLEEIGEHEFNKVNYIKGRREAGNSRFKTQNDYPFLTVTFNKDAPAVFASKSFKLEQNLYPFAFYGEDRFVLTDWKTKLIFVDENFKTVAKISVKGCPTQLRNGYVLTVGAGSFWAYEYSKNDMIRIYKISG